MQIENEIKQYGLKNNVPISLDDTLSLLLDTIKTNNCKQILEIGTAIGYSSIAMAQNTACEHIDTVEIDEARYKVAVENIKNANLTDKITPYLMDAKDYLQQATKKYDFVYLDGPKGQYINYLPKVVELLNPQGIIFADNLYFHGMVTGKIPVTKNTRSMIRGLHNYIDEISNTDKYITTIYDIGDGVGITRVKPN